MVQAVIIHFICLSLFGVSLFALRNLDEFFSQNRIPIATVEKFAGDARVRPIDLSLWRELNQNHKLYEGDVLVTGRQSYARLTFNDGRNLDLDEKSLITLAAEDSSSKDASVLITLVQGSLSAKANSAKPKSDASGVGKKGFKLVSAGTKIALNSAATSIQMSKTTTEKDAGIKVISGSVQVNNSMSGKNLELKQNEVIGKVVASPILTALGQIKLPQQIIDPKMASFAPTASTEAPPSETIAESAPLIVKAVEQITPRAQDFPEIILPKQQATLWTTASLDRMEGKSLAVVMSRPVFPKEVRWIPILEAKGQKKIVAPVKGKEGKLVHSIDLSQLKILATSEESAGLKTLSLEIRPGLLIKADTGDESSKSENMFSNKPSFVHFRSFSDLPDSKIAIRLSKIAPRENASSPWIIQDTKKEKSNNQIQIILKRKSDLASIMSVLKGDDSFEIEASKESENGAVSCFVRKGAVFATAKGRRLTGEELRSLIQLFGADFAFFGKESAYIPRVRDFFALKYVIRAEKIKADVYVLDRGKLVPLKTSLLEKDPKAIATLFDQVSAFFKEEVVVTELSH
jgi:hypothetical protein